MDEIEAELLRKLETAIVYYLEFALHSSNKTKIRSNAIVKIRAILIRLEEHRDKQVQQSSIILPPF
jgi:hypothetical protein